MTTMMETLKHSERSDLKAVDLPDIYFSADVETDGPIPGPFSLLSFALVLAGTFDGLRFTRVTPTVRQVFYREMMPISSGFQREALEVNGLDRMRLLREGCNPVDAMSQAARWVEEMSAGGRPVLVAYPLSFDWSWLYWYFIRYSDSGSPFSYSQCFDLKTAFAVKGQRRIADSGRGKLPLSLKSNRQHSHNALDDALEQADIFGNVFEWDGADGHDS